MLESVDQPAAWIELPAGETVVCRGRKRVVVVVPGLAERWGAEPGEVAGTGPWYRRTAGRRSGQSELIEKVA